MIFVVIWTTDNPTKVVTATGEMLSTSIVRSSHGGCICAKQSDITSPPYSRRTTILRHHILLFINHKSNHFISFGLVSLDRLVLFLEKPGLALQIESKRCLIKGA
ncbi:hypothetical protein CEXT_396621 [Caerostris extrusa]|uniref:Uncharacterized protein n=1 Tax=Caerostris extrusa TaxID=172846 RepID=A0AAV4N9A4_CAEEX|nr:hypothetical protein CEXT_396621 [Caerostris extrusa]